MSDRFTRRRVLTGVAAAGLTGFAGCSLQEEQDPEEFEDEAEDEPVEDVDHENPSGNVSFVEPEDGAEVESPVEVEFETEDFEVVPEEEEIEHDAGHLHLLIDRDPITPGEIIPDEEGYIHYSEGETDDQVDLDPGEYDLVAQASDSAHIAYDMDDEVSITVVDPEDTE